MQTQVLADLRNTPAGIEAESILRRCVHCGFCNATCPTYQITGDELDGPRGRIYLIKQMMEGEVVSAQTRSHLDRCLTCRNCETTCPSGVQYGHLAEIGRGLIEQRAPRPWLERGLRRVLTSFLLSGPLFAWMLRIGRGLRPLLPAALRQKIPLAGPQQPWPRREHSRKWVLLAGCVQPAMMPNINGATARVLDRLGIQTLILPQARCCGALRLHLGQNDAALRDVRRSIDAWWPLVEAGVEGFVMNASGCGVTVREWGHLLRDDAAYADKAARISAMTRDISELLVQEAPQLSKLQRRAVPSMVAFHPPCSLQHGQQLRGKVEGLLQGLGIAVKLPRDSHLCCGSAGTYSLLQAELSGELRRRKLEALDQTGAQQIVSANVGCIAHLQRDDAPPVQHWIELLDNALESVV